MDPSGSRVLPDTAWPRGRYPIAFLPLAVCVCLVISGCQTDAPASVPAPVVGVPPESVPVPEATSPPIDLDRLDELLELGDRALRDDRLLTPVDDSAYDYYQAALKVAPGHPAARHGLDRLVDRYIALASEAAQRGQYDRARNILERAKFVNPDHEGLPMAEAQIDVFRHAKRRRVVLDTSGVSSRSIAVATALTELGRAAKAEGMWVVITARSDAEGRWIYQQLRRAPGERRIRAELVISGTPSVEIVELDDDDSP